MRKAARIMMAKENLAHLQQGFYWVGDKKVQLNKPKTPECLEVSIPEFLNQEKWYSVKDNIMRMEITKFIERFCLVFKGKKLLVLNFADAWNICGGFLLGYKAQEECLAYTTTLFGSLSDPKVDDFYYNYNKNLGTPLYSDRMIYSDDILYYRNLEGTKFLKEPLPVSILTSPAPNRKYCTKNGIPVETADKALRDRIFKIVTVIAQKKPDCVALGAFGCGVFGNDRAMVYSLFEEAINKLIPKDSIVVVFPVI